MGSWSSLEELMKLSEKIEEKNIALLEEETGEKQSSGRANSNWASTVPQEPREPRWKGVTPASSSGSNGGERKWLSKEGNSSSGSVAGSNQGTRKWLSREELKERFEKGLCIKCGDKFVRGHICRNGQLKTLLIQCDEEGEGEFALNEQELIEQQLMEAREGKSEEVRMELSQQSLVGISSPKTFKIRGRLLDKEVVVLIDSGATHNFLAWNVVQSLGIKVSGKGFTVQLGNGEKVRGEGCCTGVELSLPGIKVIENFFPFQLGGVDVILGVAWLSKLGEIHTN